MKKKILSLIAASVLGSAALSAQTGDELPFQKWALTPPMGWNSWDCYGPTVTEDEVKANADYMSTKLLSYGWEYIVVDIRWFVENDKAGGYNQTDPIYTIDAYGRYTPATNRFPSAANGNGFKPLADYVHNRGMKFGIHIMRGVPKEAVQRRLPVLGTDGAVTCDMIANGDSACTWLSDNMKVDCTKPGSQEYYNSIFDLYASWGVDYVKVDDISRPYHTGEIEMIRKAIDQCGRPIVLSLSPGETPVEQYEHLSTHANLWRTVDDFWDNWDQLSYQFNICAKWAPYIKPGAWPDADMLPLGKIAIRGERGTERWTNFTRDEQFTLMNLWTIFKSPLMFGGNLPENDAFTDSLLTNRDVLYMHNYSAGNRQLLREDSKVIWTADDPANGDKFAALFNLGGDEYVRTANALYRSGTISYLTTGFGQNVEADIPEGSTQLALIVTDAGDGYDSDHADWINPTLILKDGSKISLTELAPIKSTCGWGSMHVNQNLEGDTLCIAGQQYENGFAVHANSILLFEIPEDAVKFEAYAGIDESGTSQGTKSSVEFMIFNEDPTTRSGVDPQKAIANSGLISRTYQKEGITLTADISGAEKLYLVVTDAGDGLDYDHANWGNPVLIDANGQSVSLRDFEWDGTPVNGWGNVQLDKNNDGGPLVINGVTYEKGYGVNATSIITFTLPEGHNYTKFSSVVGYDSDMDDAPQGVTVEFLVFTKDPAPAKENAITLDLRDLGFADGQECTVTDMWSGENIGTYSNDGLAPLIPQHGSRLFRISANGRTGGASVSLGTERTSYQADETFPIVATVSGGNSEGAYVQLLCDGKIIGTLPVGTDGTATYQCSDLYNGEHEFQALYSGTTAIANATSPTLSITIEGGEAEDLEPLRQRYLSLYTEAENIDLSLCAGSTRDPLFEAMNADVWNMDQKADLEAAITTLETTMNAALASQAPMASLLQTLESVTDFCMQIRESEEKTNLETLLSEGQSIYVGDNSTTEEVVRIDSELQQAYVECKLSAQPEEGMSIEMTEFITNPSFESGTTGWELFQDGSGWTDMNTWNDRPAVDGTYFISVAQENISQLDLYQELTGLPAGRYSLEVSLRNTDGVEYLTDQHAYAQAGDKTAIDSEPLTNVSGGNNNDWSHFRIEDILLGEGETLRIGVRSTGTGSGRAGWFQADNFRLYYWGYDEGTGISTPAAAEIGLKFYQIPGGILVESDAEGSLPVYTLGGALYKTARLQAGSNKISLPKGQYICKGTVILID